MSTLSQVQAELTDALTTILEAKDIEYPVIMLERPADFQFGDLTTNLALRYARQLRCVPLSLAEEIAGALRSAAIASVHSVSVATPGFINITLTEDVYLRMLEEITLSSDSYGVGNVLQGQTWVIEHTSPNPNKAMHLGHLRNNLVGMGLVRILQAQGATVISDCVDNNRGIAIAKVMWGFLDIMRKEETTEISVVAWTDAPSHWYTPEGKGVLPDVFVTQCYIAGEAAVKADPAIDKAVRALVVAWEAGDEAVWKLWQHVLSYAYAGMERTLTRLGNHWDKVWHEHEHYARGKGYVEEGLTRGIFQTLDDGAVLTKLEAYHIPDTILLKNDGTSLYITQDIALTALKKETYHADRLVWVIGPEQSLAMRQLFAVCEQLGIGQVDDFTHVPYGYVGIRREDGGFQKMSSRAGTVILIDDVLDAVKETLTEQFNTENASEALFERLAVAAVKFSLLKSERTQDITFDPEESIATTGDSGIYLMYTYVRTQSILRKGGASITLSAEHERATSAHEVEQLLLFYPEVTARAAADLSVHHIAQYLLELAGAFNAWYAKETILDGSSSEIHKRAVTTAVGVTLRSGLALLGIVTVEEM